MVPLGILHGGFVANLEGGLRVPGIEALTVYSKGVKDAVRVFAFLCDGTARPVTGRESHFPALFGGEGVVGGVVEAQLPAGAGILGHALRCGQVAAAILLQHFYRVGSLPDEFLQPFLLQLVGGKSAISALYKQLELQAAVQRMGGFVHLSVQEADQVHQAFGQGDAHLLRTGLPGKRQAVLCQVYLRLCEGGSYLVDTHIILLQQLVRQSGRWECRTTPVRTALCRRSRRPNPQSGHLPRRECARAPPGRCQ